MNQQEINKYAEDLRAKALDVLELSGVRAVWETSGCRVNLVGSVRMDLMGRHRDIDLHVYSSGITEDKSFAVAAKMSALPGVTEITAINGLHTSEHCMAWHVHYRSPEGEFWKFDIIHIESGTTFDGFFENMADRILAVMNPVQHDTILRLKFDTPDDELIRGVEYYEAVIADGVTTLDDLRSWLKSHRAKEPYYWVP